MLKHRLFIAIVLRYPAQAINKCMINEFWKGMRGVPSNFPL